MLGCVIGKALGRVDCAQSPRHTTRNDPKRNKDVNRMKGLFKHERGEKLLDCSLKCFGFHIDFLISMMMPIRSHSRAQIMTNVLFLIPGNCPPPPGMER